MVATAVPMAASRSPSGMPRASMMIHQSSSSSQRIEEEAGPQLSDHVVLLVQEWLTIARLPATLQCFADEYTRSQSRAPPTLDKWYEMIQAIDLAAITAAAAKASHDPLNDLAITNPALLERIVSQSLAHFRQRQAKATVINTPTTVVLGSKRPATAAPMLKFTSKRSLPTGSTTSIVQSKSLSTLRSSASRPKSAAAIAASRSTPELASGDPHTPNDVRLVSNNSAADEQRPAVLLRKGSHALTSPKKSPSAATSLAASPATRRRSSLSTRLPLTPSARSSPDQRSVSSSSSPPLREPPPGGDARPEVVDDGDLGVVELEDMTEESLADHFSGFSRGNIKKLRRVLTKSSAHSQELQRSRAALAKLQLRAQQKHERSAFAAKQTELLSTTMDMLIKEPCSLCRYVFLKKNLATKVSYKSICDLRASWQQQQVKANGQAAVVARVMDSHDDDGSGDDTGTQATTLESTQQISHLYDEVSVCAFCAQLALDFASYRPSSAQQRDRKEAARRLALDRQRQRDLQRQRDRVKCDPLAFHAYELNSDDDEDEETLEVDANGRVHVVRRPRSRRRATRTPAQTGLVSKRLHYDHLRSQSIHALNRQEWEIISQSQQQ
jgi:hypothetical protein